MKDKTRRHMNVIEIIADQHQATCMGCEGHPQAITPNMNRLATQGVRFSHAYTQNPICTPSRVSILSGQYCHNHGYYGLSGPKPSSLPSFFSHFKENGYKTAGIGNLHTPNYPRNWLEDHLDLFGDCFESVDGREEQTAWYDMIRKLGVLEKEDFHFWWRNPEYFLEGMPSKLPFELSQEGWCVQEAIRFIDSCGEQPFCMQVSLERPHQPFFPDKRFWDMYPEDLDLPPTINQDPSHRPPHFQAVYKAFRRHTWAIEPKNFLAGARRIWRGYLACITHIDHALGLLLDHLEKTRLAEKTIIIYHADHGGYSGTHGILEKAPGICSEAVCRIPFLWFVPHLTVKGHICHHLVENVDIAPTIVSLCDLPPMETVDGHDISPLLRGERHALRHIAVTENPWSKALRWKQWRFVHYQPEMFRGQNVGELYNIEEDPHENRNLYHSIDFREIVHNCRRLLLEWLIRTTRVTTVHPTLSDLPPPHNYATSADGKEARSAGPLQRVAKGKFNYI
jgi:choline-sulfatase/uncharacterized sulfatase